MSNTTQTTGLQTIKSVFENEDVRKRFYDMLGKKAAGFIVSVINVVSNDTKLARADRNSILFAAATAATLDLPVNPNLGFAYIIAYEDRKTGQIKAQFQMGYKGFIQLAQRSGLFQTVSGSAIYEGQLIEENPLTGYKFDFNKKVSDKIIGYAGYFKLINGFEKVIYMTVEELEKHGGKYSQSFKYDIKQSKKLSLWSTDFNAMSIKTVLKLLLSKYAPLSIEMQTAVRADQAVIHDWDAQDVEAIEYADNDNKPLTPEETAKNKEEAKVKKHIESATTIEKLSEAESYCMGLPEDHELRGLYETKFKELMA